jgi:hypothetical protein
VSVKVQRNTMPQESIRESTSPIFGGRGVCVHLDHNIYSRKLLFSYDVPNSGTVVTFEKNKAWNKNCSCLEEREEESICLLGIKWHQSFLNCSYFCR